jgi:dolichyl-phosphate beta-glucosyltransferase
MLDETMVYLQRRQRRDASFTFEVVIVDDGSGDGTTTCALKFVHQYSSNVVRVLTLRQNRGKGFAVKTGMQHARGQLLLMVDADGATRIADLENLEARLRQVHQVWLAGKASNEPGIINGDCAIAIGSRAPPQALYEQDSVVVQRDGDRSLVSNLFRLLRRLLMPTEGVDLGGMSGGAGIEQERRALQDTQCGFKLFTRGAAQQLFNNQHLDRWAFDVELMYLAKQLQLPVIEVPVTWSEVDGSKLSMVRDGIKMAIDMLIARVLYVTGVRTSAVCIVVSVVMCC